MIEENIDYTRLERPVIDVDEFLGARNELEEEGRDDLVNFLH